jgi:alkanesulfonate monooxygenase SsuD/methylene tetrahydromethanopterin reductase-like flavin-dependent oxidoreductase (luciferase family)
VIHGIRFGYKASAEQFGPSELLDYAVLAEKAGFDSAARRSGTSTSFGS